MDRSLRRLAWVLVLGGIAPFLDTTIVNVALDRLGGRMHASLTSVQWVVTGYLLALAMAIPVSGWAVERFGGQRMWMISLVLFLAGSVLAGAAWNIDSLIAFRVVQGIGGGLIQPTLMTLLMRAAGGRPAGRLIAAVSMPAVVVPILGPVVGGLIVNGLSWRWIFLVNVPICLVALALARRYVPETPPAGEHRLDVIGLALLSPALAAIVYGLSRTGVAVLPVAAGALLLAGYVVHALRTRREPIIDLRLLRVRSFAAATCLLFLAGLSMFGAMLLLPLYYQQVRGESVLAAGLLLAPQGLGSLLPRTVAGRLTDCIGPRRVVLAGIALTVLGTVPYALGGAHTSEALLGASLVVRGAGLAAVTIAVMAAAYEGLGPDQVAHASTMTRIFQQLGGSFGAAVLAVILERGLDRGPAVAFGHTFWWSIGFTVPALVPALLLTGRREVHQSGRRVPRSTARMRASAVKSDSGEENTV